MSRQHASMMLVNGTIEIGQKEHPTFRLIPTDLTCPYNEAVYYPTDRVLFVMSKEKKTYLQQTDKKDKEVIIEKFYEYFITTHNEIDHFIKMFTQNFNEFDYLRFMQN